MEEGVSESFLQEELDAFDKIYTELLGIASSDKDTEGEKENGCWSSQEVKDYG